MPIAGILDFVARALLSGIFLISAVRKIIAPAGFKAYIAAFGLPNPDLAFWVSVVFDAGFGLALLAGYKLRWVSLILAAYAVVLALVFHTNFHDSNQLNHFLKNLGIAGGLLYVAVHSASGMPSRRR